MNTDKVRIWSHEHKQWWRPNSCGYTENQKEAGLYTLEEAHDIIAESNINGINEEICPVGPNEERTEALEEIGMRAIVILNRLSDAGVFDSPKGPRAEQAVKDAKSFMLGNFGGINKL